jgi:hypothetical protein
MNVTPEMAATLTFERFWRWLQDHGSCIVEAGSPTIAMFDFEDFHWTFAQEEDGRAVVQMARGKNPVAEMVIDPGEVLFVQASPDTESASRGHWLFEVTAGTREDPFVSCYFVMAHGVENGGRHEVLKH